MNHSVARSHRIPVPPRGRLAAKLEREELAKPRPRLKPPPRRPTPWKQIIPALTEPNSPAETPKTFVEQLLEYKIWFLLFLFVSLAIALPWILIDNGKQ